MGNEVSVRMSDVMHEAKPFVAHYVEILAQGRRILPTVFHKEITKGNCDIAGCPLFGVP